MTNAFHTVEANVYGLPTACADRNERYGWFCDTDVAAQSSAFFVDMAALWTKSIRDIRDGQYGPTMFGNYFYHGYYDIINPSVGGGGVGDVGISSGGVIRPWRLYQNYADARMLGEDYLSVSNWLYFLGVNWPSNHLTPWEAYVDVCDMDQYPFNVPFPSGWATSYSQMSGSVQSLWAYLYSADIAAKMSQVLQHQALQSGDTALAAVFAGNYTGYTNTAATLRTYFTNSQNGLVSYDNTGTNIIGIGQGTQGDYGSALYFDMVPTPQRSNCAYLMLNDMNKGIVHYNHNYIPPPPSLPCTNHFSTGAFATTRALLALTSMGYNSEAYELVLNYQFPSWLYQITNGGAVYRTGTTGSYGASTGWEHWNGWVSGTGGGYGRSRTATYNSFNELWNTSVAEWVWTIVAGINPDDNSPGFENVIISPQPGGGITNCFAVFGSIHGKILSTWATTLTNYSLSVAIPANTTASVFIVGATNLAEVTESGMPASNAVGVLALPTLTNGAALFQVGSGSYSFNVAF
jgi:alpha-L-rhamnosidase